MGRSLNIRLQDGDRERLREIARKVGAIAPSGGPKGQPSISRLLMMVASGELAVEREERGTMTTATIRDAYQHLMELEPGTDRTMEQLRDYIQEKGLRYDQLDEAFWDGLLDSAWVLGTDAD